MAIFNKEFNVKNGLAVNGTVAIDSDRNAFLKNVTYTGTLLGDGHITAVRLNSTDAKINSIGVGSGVTIPTTDGEIRATGSITAYYSDERLKENIEDIQDALSKVMTLRGVTYNGNALAETFGYTSKERQVGVLAGDVQKVLPEAVKPAPFDILQLQEGTEISRSGENYKTVQYEKIVPLLIQAIKELKEEVDRIKG